MDIQTIIGYVMINMICFAIGYWAGRKDKLRNSKLNAKRSKNDD